MAKTAPQPLLQSQVRPKLRWTDYSSPPPSLPHGFVEADPGGDGDIQALDRAGHGNVYEAIAALVALLALLGDRPRYIDTKNAPTMTHKKYIVVCPLIIRIRNRSLG